MGNQCSDCEMGVMCSHSLFLVSTRATELFWVFVFFWKNFRLERLFLRRPEPRVLERTGKILALFFSWGKKTYLTPVFNVWEKTACSQNTHPDYVKMS